MKKSLLCTAFLSATLVALGVNNSSAALVITEVMSSSAHGGGTSNGDWFELTNNGVVAVDVTGWSWDDSGNLAGAANFGSITSIGAGQSIVFTEETVGAEASWMSDWNLSGVTVVNLGSTVFQGLGSGGDAVNIYNGSSALVTSVTFGAATQGFSFAWDRNGNSLGVSVLGQDGAVRATSNGQTTGNGPGVDVGSPGFAAVPEPGTLALIGLGLGAILWNGRRRRA